MRHFPRTKQFFLYIFKFLNFRTASNCGLTFSTCLDPDPGKRLNHDPQLINVDPDPSAAILNLTTHKLAHS